VPHLLALAGGAGLDLLAEGVVIGEQADVNVAEGYNDGSGEGGYVHHVRRALAFGVFNGVDKDQAALGVRVEYFDGLAAEAGDDVAGALGVAANGVFDRRDVCRHRNGWFQ